MQMIKVNKKPVDEEALLSLPVIGTEVDGEREIAPAIFSDAEEDEWNLSFSQEHLSSLNC